MNKHFLTFLVLVLCFKGLYSQSKLFSKVELDFIVPSTIEYNYSNNNVGSSINLESQISLALQYSINYNVFKKFNLGMLTGVQQQYGADFFMYKIGGRMQYHFVDTDNVYSYIHYAGNFTVDRDKFKNGNNLRIGIGFPIIRKINSTLNIFYDINHFNLSDSNPLIFGNETPESIFFRSFGISLGIKF